MTYKGSCHCGAVSYEVEGEIDGVIQCNCSICHRKGAPLWFVGRSQLTITKGADVLKDYTFNKHVIKHRFCPTCGIHTHGEGTDPKGDKMAAINVRCLEGVELDSIEITPFNGRAM